MSQKFPMFYQIRHLLYLLVKPFVTPRLLVKYIVPYMIGSILFLMLFSAMFFVQRSAAGYFRPHITFWSEITLSIDELLFFSGIFFCNLVSCIVMLFACKNSLQAYLSQPEWKPGSERTVLFFPELKDWGVLSSYWTLTVTLGVACALSFRSAELVFLTLLLSFLFFFMNYLSFLTKEEYKVVFIPSRSFRNLRFLVLISLYLFTAFIPLLPIVLLPMFITAAVIQSRYRNHGSR